MVDNTDIAIYNSVFKIGVVFSVDGRTVKIRVDKNKNSSHLIYKGTLIKNVSVGSYVKILKGFVPIIGKVESEYIVEDKKADESDYLDAPIDHISEDSLVFKGCNTDTIVIARTGGDGNDKNYTETIAKATLGDDKGSISIQKIEENGKIVLYFEVKIIPQYWDVQETKIENNVRQKPTNISYSADSSYNNVSLKFRYDTGLDRNHFEW